MEKYGLDAANAVMEKARLVCRDLQNVKREKQNLPCVFLFFFFFWYKNELSLTNCEVGFV